MIAKRFVPLLASIIAATVGGAAGPTALSSALQAGPPPTGSHVVPPRKGNKSKLLYSLYQWGPGEGAAAGTPPLVSGFQALDAPAAAPCSAAAGCRIVATETAAISSPTAANSWALCAIADGSFMDSPDCSYQVPPSPPGFILGFQIQSICVAQGNHTVQTNIYVTDPATLGPWAVTYNVSTPC